MLDTALELWSQIMGSGKRPNGNPLVIPCNNSMLSSGVHFVNVNLLIPRNVLLLQILQLHGIATFTSTLCRPCIPWFLYGNPWFLYGIPWFLYGSPWFLYGCWSDLKFPFGNLDITFLYLYGVEKRKSVFCAGEAEPLLNSSYLFLALLAPS